MNSPRHFYRLGSKIGKGSFGSVYQGFYTKPGQPQKIVAIKVLPDSKYSKQEADLMASIRSHPNVCRFLDTWVLQGKRYIAMELINGISLRDWLNSLDFDEPDEPIDWRKIIDILLQIFSGIAHLHRHLIYHGDLKPANIMIVERDDGNIDIKLVDFGASSHFDAIPQIQMGSPLYFSPQIAHKTGIDGSSDLWAMGVILHEFVSGGWEKPWFLRDTKNAADIVERLKTLDYATTPFPPELLQHENPIVAFLAGIAQRCLALDKSERPRAQDVVTELTAKLAELRDA
jgi:serine/threonine protein kinase